jgi:hypothetical protein
LEVHPKLVAAIVPTNALPHSRGGSQWDRDISL